jgi:glutaredoxin-like protein
MPTLNPALQTQVRQVFAALDAPVTLAVFTDGGQPDSSCEMCGDTRQLVEELALLSDGKVSVEVYDVEGEPEAARRFGVNRVPAIVLLGGESGQRDLGIRFFGAPSGYEFGTLVEDVRMASTGRSDLSASAAEALSNLTRPLHIQVFVTPTCPYCPRAVLLAHKMALASEMVTAEMIDATEFPELADRYQVHGVPKTVINDTVHVEGAVPEAVLMAQLVPLLSGA